jgi:hypothetical protein
MPVDQGKLTVAQQKDFSELMNKIKKQETIIRKQEAITHQSPTYIVRRAKQSVEYHKKQLEEHERIASERLQRVIDETQKQNTQGREDKERYLRDAEDKLESCLSEKHKSVISAEEEIKTLQEQLDRMNLPLLSVYAVEEIKQVKFIKPPITPAPKDYWKQQEEEELARSRASRPVDSDEEVAPSKKVQEDYEEARREFYKPFDVLDGKKLVYTTTNKRPVKKVYC